MRHPFNVAEVSCKLERSDMAVNRRSRARSGSREGGSDIDANWLVSINAREIVPAAI
jgi:hypothetical protein